MEMWVDSMRLNGEPLEEVDCFKYLWSQVAADRGCERDMVHRMNQGYRAWGVLKSMPSNRGLGMNAMKCLYEGVIVPTELYSNLSINTVNGSCMSVLIEVKNKGD